MLGTPGWRIRDKSSATNCDAQFHCAPAGRTLERTGFESVRAWPLLPVRDDYAHETVFLAELRGAAQIRIAPPQEGDKFHDVGNVRSDGTRFNEPRTASPATLARFIDAAPPTPVCEVRFNKIEQLVANAWLDVLGLETVGLNDDFLNLGGDSILATQVISRLKSYFPLELELRGLFDARTVKLMAQMVEAELIERIDELPEETVSTLFMT